MIWPETLMLSAAILVVMSGGIAYITDRRLHDINLTLNARFGDMNTRFLELRNDVNSRAGELRGISVTSGHFFRKPFAAAGNEDRI